MTTNRYLQRYGTHAIAPRRKDAYESWEATMAARSRWTPAEAAREREFRAELDWQRGMAEAVREEERILAAIDRDHAERERQRVPDFIGPNPTPNRY